MTKSRRIPLKQNNLQDQVLSLSELDKLLQLSLENSATDDLYSRVLETIFSFPRLGNNCKGILFLLERERLVPKTHHALPTSLLKKCSTVRFGQCGCGKAAQSKLPVFLSPSAKKDNHCFEFLPEYVRYCIPILTTENQLLGVLTIFIEEQEELNQLTEQVLLKTAQVIAGIINRKKTENKLQERTELLSSIYSAADSIGLVVTDLHQEDATIVRFSPGAEKMFGYQEEEVVNNSIAALYQEEKKQSIPRRVQLLRQGKKVTATDMVMRKKDGSLFPVVVNINPFIDNNGQVTRALSVINDISTLKKVQLELKQTNAALEKRVNERTRELQLAQQQVLHAEKLAAIGQLSASIAHEFNSPLQGVMTVLKGVSKRAVLDEEDLLLVESALEECNRMTKLIRDLQNFNRPSSGKCSWINLHQVLDSLFLLYKNDFHTRKIGLIKVYDAELPAICVVVDQIRQVVINLLNNGVDACEKGGTITVSTKVVEDAVELTVTDTGHGIPPEDLQHIFEPFFTNKSAVKGTGLGLSVCYGIVKSHKGTIRMDSLPDKGTRFTITLPLKRTL